MYGIHEYLFDDFVYTVDSMNQSENEYTWKKKKHQKPRKHVYSLFFLELIAAVHRQATGTATESVSLWSVLSAMAILAVQLGFVFSAVCAV